MPPLAPALLAATLIASFLAALVPAIVFLINLHLYREPPAPAPGLPAVSILIPARNEAAGIEAAVSAALASTGTPVEVIVMDDASTDATPAIVRSLAQADPRVRLAHAPTLPPEWNGKQHACWALAHAANHPILCFVDADVCLAPACIARMATFLGTRDNALVSGFPRQLTGTFLESLLLPLIHFVLLGFLPIGRMRAGTDPAFSAGCGQFLMTTREAYFATGGHSQIRTTMHDGLRLPRLYRQHGLRTDLADLTPLATCRMYTTAPQVWSGLAKNATEGLAAPARIVPITLLLLFGQVLPFLAALVLLLLSVHPLWLIGALGMPLSPLGTHLSLVSGQHPLAATLRAALTPWLSLALLACVCAWLPRLLGIHRFRQSPWSSLVHPTGILTLLILEWYALARQLLGRPVTWRTRTYSEKPT